MCCARVALSSLFVTLALACGGPTSAPSDGGALDAARLDARIADATVAPDAHAADAALEGGGALADDEAWRSGPPLGARRTRDGALEVRVRAPNATHIEVALFDMPLGASERLRVPMHRPEGSDRFEVHVSRGELEAAGIDGTIHYGLRVWGPNWPFDPAWTPGSLAGFVVDIDAAGNRMNPNKVVLDPYALEVSHDPIGPGHTDFRPFRGDEAHRAIDSAPHAPKGVVIDVPPPVPPGPGRALRDHVVYEVHLRGLTRGDASLPEAERGTYAGARRRAASLGALGVTAIELLPLHETPNDQNDLTEDAQGDNYWGYSTLSFFAPDRRYASDRSPGGPTRELQEMVRAFHDEGLEVWVDVVYNHTTEGTGSYLSWRGVDDATYYVHREDARQYVNNNGVGPDVATMRPVPADMVIDSLRYWHEVLGVDGFRFDLASVLGNACQVGCFRYESGGILRRIAETFARPRDGGRGAILVAEPWGTGAGTYRLGEFPEGWAEWNDRYRDTVRRDLNRLGREVVTLRELHRRFAGSPDLFGARGSGAGISFVTAHDGFTLADLFAYDTKNNAQPWPWGPSDGGSDWEIASRHGGDPALQRRVARTALALLALSRGVPMITGGDEHLRTQRGNNNPYNLDSPAMWLDPRGPEEEPVFFEMTRRLFAFRHAHAALRPSTSAGPFDDDDGDGRPALVVYRDDAQRADDRYLDAPDRHFVSWVIDGDELGDRDAAIWIAYNGWSGAVSAHPPPPPDGTTWRLVMDTGSAGAAFGHVVAGDDALAVASWPRVLEGRTFAVFVAR